MEHLPFKIIKKNEFFPNILQNKIDKILKSTNVSKLAKRFEKYVKIFLVNPERKFGGEIFFKPKKYKGFLLNPQKLWNNNKYVREFPFIPLALGFYLYDK